jgi:hypothetical protein
LGKKFFNSLKSGQFFFFNISKIIVQFCELYGSKKRYDKKFFSPLAFIAVFGSGIRDPGSGMGKIRIRDKHPGAATLNMGK